MDSFQSAFDEFRRAVRVADVIDVALISVLLYAVLTWFRETTSRSVYIGISILALVYLMARVFDMYLTTLFFQAVVSLLLIALVVVFQEDLRRIFERLAALGTIRETQHRDTHLAHVDTLVEVSTELSHKKVGGLMVLKGRDPLDRHIDGGVDVDGRISKPLLDSIFDPHSMGHDGAVVIERSRIKLCSAHLPLSKNAVEIGPRGTRHSAGLGLAEVSDALVIVISEERGQISLAQGGKLELMSSASQLQDRLEKFCHDLAPRKTEDLWKRMLKQNAGMKAVSIVVACIAWFMLSYREGTVQQTFVVPIEFRNVPKDLVFDEPPAQVRITLSGRESAFTLLAPSTLKVSVDVSNIEEGKQRLPLEDEYVKRPSNLAVYLIEPRTLALSAQTMVSVTLPIKVETDGRPPSGFELKHAQASPSSVSVMVWRSRAEATSQLFTEPIDLTKLDKTSTVPATLEIPSHVHFPEGKPPEIRVLIEIVKSSEQKPTTNSIIDE